MHFNRQKAHRIHSGHIYRQRLLQHTHLLEQRAVPLQQRVPIHGHIHTSGQSQQAEIQREARIIQEHESTITIDQTIGESLLALQRSQIGAHQLQQSHHDHHGRSCR